MVTRGKCKFSLGKVAFSHLTDFTSGKFTKVKFHGGVNALRKTIGRFKGRSVSPDKPSPVLDTVLAVRDRLVGLICKRRVRS